MRSALLLVSIVLMAVTTSCADLGTLQMMRDVNWSSWLNYTDNIHGPGLLVSDLPACDDSEFIESIQSVLNEYAYDTYYTPNLLDCSNGSQITWAVLKGRGFDPRIAYNIESVYSLKDRSSIPLVTTGHVWVMVPRNNYTGGDFEDYVYHKSGGWVPIETTVDMGNRLGIVISPDLGTTALNASFPTMEGLILNTSTEYSLISGDTYDVLMLPAVPIHRVAYGTLNDSISGGD